MGKDEQELLEAYRGLIPENKANFLAHARIALAAQKNALKGAQSDPEKDRKTA
jgi:hypothetical protein